MWGFKAGDIERVFGRELLSRNAYYPAGYFNECACYYKQHCEPINADHARRMLQQYLKMARGAGG